MVSLIKLRVDWDGSTGLAQTGAELSSRVVSPIETWRGRDFASSLIGKSVAGGLTCTLNNISGDYNSFKSSGPLFGNLDPTGGQAVRLTELGRAAQFVRANSEYLSIADNASLSTGDIDFTTAAWIYLDSKSNNRDLVGKWQGISNREWLLYYAAGLDRFRFAVSSSGSAFSDEPADVLGSPSIGTWYFIVVWHDATANTINIQVNNGIADSLSHTGGLTDLAADFQIGSLHNGTNYHDGRIVSVGFWKKVLTSAEKTFLWRDGDGVRYKDIGLTGDGSALKTSLEGWWDLQEASGNRADSEGSNTLTDNNTVTDNEGIYNFSSWKGLLRSITPIPSLGGFNTAQLVAVGPLGQVNQNKIRLAAVESELTGTAFNRVLTEASWPTADRTVDVGKTTMVLFGVENEVNTLTALRRIENTDAGFTGESPDGRIVFEDRRHRQLSPHTTSQSSWTDAAGGPLNYSSIPQEDSQQQLFHIFTVAVQLYTDVSIATLWTLSSSGSDSPSIEPGESLTFWAEFPNPSSATNAFDVKLWTTPVENTDYEANTQAGGGGDDKSSQLGFVVTKFANSMRMVITNNDAAKVFLTLLQARGTTRTKDDISRVTVEKTADNPKTFPNPPQYIPTIAEAFDWANWFANVFGVVQPLLGMRVNGDRSVVQRQAILELDISDRITVTATNKADLGIGEDFFIESTRRTIDPRANTHWTDWLLSAVANQEAWTLGISALGTSTRLAQ